MPPLYIDRLPALEFVDGAARYTFAEGCTVYIPMRLFRQGEAQAKRKLAEYDEHRAEVVVLAPRRKRRAADG